MFSQQYTYSTHYGASQVPEHLDGTVVDTMALPSSRPPKAVTARGLEVTATR